LQNARVKSSLLQNASSGFTELVANGVVRMARFQQSYISIMLETIAIVLIILWLLGLVSSYTMGGFIHILLVLAVIVILIRLIQGRQV
jgi:ABC-type transport system involved in cytochrome bd biosynthesis fused ATPase/permease subunit